MATDTITTLDLVTLAQEFRGDVVRQINRRTMTLKMLRVVAGEGKNVAFAPEADGQVAENYADGADAENFGGDVQDSAILSWGLYRANFHLSKLAMDAAKTSGSPVGNRMLWARNLINASAKLAATLNVACFAGLGTGTEIAGLDMALEDGNQYATINRASSPNAYFRSTVVDPGVLTAPTFALIRNDVRLAYEACGENPDVAVCNPLIFNKVGGLFDTTRRSIDNISTAKGKITLDFGFQALEVDGTMFVKDKDSTAATIYYLNTNYVELQYLPSANMSGLPQYQVSADDGFGSVPLGFDYEMLAKTGASEKAEVTSTIQLVVSRPNSCVKRLNVQGA